MKSYTHCKRCRRRLKNPESIRLGIGSTCAHKLRLNGEQQIMDFEGLNDVLTEEEKESGSVKL